MVIADGTTVYITVPVGRKLVDVRCTAVSDTRGLSWDVDFESMRHAMEDAAGDEARETRSDDGP